MASKAQTNPVAHTGERAQEIPLRLRPATVELPYPHFVADEVYSAESAESLIGWLEEGVPWQGHRSSFYDQDECNLQKLSPPRECATLLSLDTTTEIRRRVARAFDTKLSDRVQVTAHRLTAGQGIGVHNDAPTDGLETHRLIVYLNRGFHDDYGGHLLVLGSNSPNDIVRVVRPLHNTGFGFAMSERSYHAVGEVKGGERYCVVYSFWDNRYADRMDDRAFDLAIIEPSIRPQVMPLLQFLIEAGADDVHHSNESLLSHLVSTFRILHKWGLPENVCLAGLFHSVYGTAAFRSATVSATSRKAIAGMIGAEAEELAYLYCRVERSSLYAALDCQPPYLLQDYKTQHAVSIDDTMLSKLMVLDLANSIEQLPRIKMSDDMLDAERKVYLKAIRHFPRPAVEDLVLHYGITTVDV